MKRYYVESMIGRIADGIRTLIEDKVITEDTRIILYGGDVFSFGMKTILANFGYRVDSYAIDDTELLMLLQRRRKIASRYINGTRDLITMDTLEGVLLPYDEKAVILIASRGYDNIKKQLEELRYVENKNFYCVCDWENDTFLKEMQGKREITLAEMQEKEKEMLAYIDDFCQKRNIRYWVCGGTLLGTIRHKGFIPWDDDVDIFMPWKDYQRFADEFEGGGLYELIEPDKTDRRDYIELFSKIIDKETMVREDNRIVQKVHPVAIDVFPLIGLPDDARERKQFFDHYYELEKKIWEDYYAGNGDLGVYNQWYEAQKSFLEKYDFDRQQYVGVLATAYKERDCTTREVYRETLRLPFEDIEVNVPTGYQEYLDRLYGKDWMQLPDESKRASHHNMTAYWL